MARPRVLVVGGGLAGVSAAWHLASSHDVVVLEQGRQLAGEASADNAGMVRRLGEDPYERALAVRTHAFLERLGPDWDGLAVSRRVGAVLGLVCEPHRLHDAAAHLRARGVRVEGCDAPAEVAPILKGTDLVWAWHLPDERVADAHALVTGFARGSRRRGVVLRTRCRVEAIVAGGGGLGVETSDGLLEADAVVLACGAWAGGLASRLGLERPLVPLRRSLLQTGPHSMSRPDHPWTWLDDVGVYVRPEAGGWLCSPCDEAVDRPAEGPGSRGTVAVENRALLLDKLARYLPAMGEPRFVGGWTGLRTFAPDRRPVLGADPDVEGLWWVAGLGGFGVTCAAAAGEAVASWMRGVATPWLSPAPVGPGRLYPKRWWIRPDGHVHHVVAGPA